MASVTLPSISAGCGGIDAFMGGFSHINSDQIVSFGKAVIANAIPFAIDLALQVWAPPLKENRDKLQAIADEFLSTSINSCQVAQTGVAAWASFAGPEAKRHVCATYGTQNNQFADWLDAQHNCKSESTKHTAKINPNVVWDALMKSAYLSSNKELTEMMMNLSGTIIYGDKGEASYHAALLNGNDCSGQVKQATVL